MDRGHVMVRLSPLHGGSFTRFRITGTVPTAVPALELRRLAGKLSFWSGYLVECALSAEREGAAWCEWWTDRLADIPERHLKVRFIIRRDTHRETGRSR
jgi:hypothetical protein